MELIEREAKIKFEMDTKHKSIHPNVPKKRIEPSPHKYLENEEDMKIEEELSAAGSACTCNKSDWVN